MIIVGTLIESDFPFRRTGIIIIAEEAASNIRKPTSLLVELVINKEGTLYHVSQMRHTLRTWYTLLEGPSWNCS